jgi:hypothetical protein
MESNRMMNNHEGHEGTQRKNGKKYLVKFKTGLFYQAYFFVVFVVKNPLLIQDK